ncbi:hypothetical protein D3C80_2199840 [compost metagenome]
MQQRALGKLALCRLDRAGELPALRNANDLVFLDSSVGQGVENRSNACRIEPDLVQ